MAKQAVFTATRHEQRKIVKERIAKFVFMAMSLTCVAPVVAILSYLVYRAWPALTWEFLTSNPEN